jgi:hypothetical protein
MLNSVAIMVDFNLTYYAGTAELLTSTVETPLPQFSTIVCMALHNHFHVMNNIFT